MTFKLRKVNNLIQKVTQQLKNRGFYDEGEG